MDSEEEKKEDKGEHINLKVKDQVRFCRRCVVAYAVLVFKRALLLLLLLLLGLFFRKRARFSFLKNRFPDLSFLRCSNETQISLSFSLKKQDNAEVHFKVKMGTKFKKVRVRVFRLLFFERRREENWMRDFYNRCSRHSLTFFLFLSRAFIFMNKTDLRRVLAAQISPTRVRSILIRRGES